METVFYEKNRTVIPNVGKVGIPIKILVQYLEEMLLVKVQEKNGTIVIKGVYSAKEIEELLETFIKIVIVCPKCNFKLKHRKGEKVYKILVECEKWECGYSELVDVIESRDSKIWKIVYGEIKEEN